MRQRLAAACTSWIVAGLRQKKRGKNAWDHSNYFGCPLVTWFCLFIHNGRIHSRPIGCRDRGDIDSCHSRSKTSVGEPRRDKVTFYRSATRRVRSVAEHLFWDLNGWVKRHRLGPFFWSRLAVWKLLDVKPSASLCFPTYGFREQKTNAN